jgi:hypothetical protein
MKTITVNVTKWHISRGKQSEPNSCPIALAVKKYGMTDVGTTSITCKGKEITMPKKAQSFVDRFDYDKPVKPFSFKLKIPE